MDETGIIRKTKNKNKRKRVYIVLVPHDYHKATSGRNLIGSTRSKNYAFVSIIVQCDRGSRFAPFCTEPSPHSIVESGCIRIMIRQPPLFVSGKPNHIERWVGGIDLSLATNP